MLYQVYFGNTLLQYLLFVSIILLGFLLKNIISKVILYFAKRSFKNITENDQISFETFLLKPIAALIFVISIYFAINCLSFPLDITVFHHKEAIDNKSVSRAILLREVIDIAFLFLILCTLFRIILRVIDFISHLFVMRSRLNLDRREEQLTFFIKELSKALVVIIGFFVILGAVFKVNVLTLITGLGIGGIAIALAAKESLENLLGSFTIFFDKPFVVGDYIKVDGVEGIVEKVGFRSTWIRTLDKTMAVIPNKNMIDGVLENLSTRTFRRVKFYVGVTYETSNDKIISIIDSIKKVLENHDAIESGFTVNMEVFNDSSIDILVSYLCKELDYNMFMQIKQDINLHIITIVEKAGSGFAYPTQRSIEERVSISK